MTNILITGAAKRIGANCARFLHSHGCNLILHYQHSRLEALALVDELNAIRSNSAVALHADLLQVEQIQDLATQALAVWGGVDVLINNASQFYPTPVEQVTEADWDNLLNSNLKAPFFLAQALRNSLIERQGCIINMVDIYAQKPLLGSPVYSIAKAGLQAMTQALAKELAPNVRVNAVAPGAILWPEVDIADSQKNEILQKVALQRCGNADDIAKAVWFLIADAPYITGQTIAVDGGRTLFI
ncbi:MAG: hypothetical protein RLZ92_1435 [Pseudomonadota bacterium]|jgi:pteridine reductase